MPERRFLYMISQGLQAFHWKAGTLVQEHAFENSDEGAEAFALYVSKSPESLYYFVADVSEEDFAQENIPFVRGKDRGALLGRKLAQRYRDTSLSLTLSLGKQEGARREERVLFSSFTNTQQFQPWLNALGSRNARLVGIYSVALVTSLLAKRLKIAAPRFVLVSLQQGGLRQSYVENGSMRFSRLARGRPANPEAAAAACASESAQIHQYLINLRFLPRESGLLDVYVLAPAAQKAIYETACNGIPRLNFHILDIDAAGRDIGLKSAPQNMLGERLYLHALAGAQPPAQFAGDALRRVYYTWRTRVALLAGGAALCALSLLISGLKFIDAQSTDRGVRAILAEDARIAAEYQALQDRFPKTPLSREDLREAVRVFEAVRQQTAFPGALFAEISHALSSAPQVELDKLDWEISSAPPGPVAKAGPAPVAAAAAAAASPAATAPGTMPHYEVVAIDAHISGVRPDDFRATKAVASQFVEALRRRPGIEVVETRMPFDFVADRALSGDVGESPSKEAPRFTLTISRRIGS